MQAAIRHSPDEVAESVHQRWGKVTNEEEAVEIHDEGVLVLRNGVRSGGFDGLVADGEEGNEEGEQGGPDEDDGVDGGTVGEVFEIVLNEPVGCGPGDDTSEADEFEEVA